MAYCTLSAVLVLVVRGEVKYNSMVMLQRAIPDEAAMDTLGVRLASLLRGGELIELVGDVGAGKTTLTRSLLRAAGVNEAIQSPTFTICNRYQADGLQYAHYDFYRLGEAGVMSEEFIETTNDPGTVTIVEWGDIVASTMPNNRLTIEIIPVSDTAREVMIAGHGQLSALEEQLA